MTGRREVVLRPFTDHDLPAAGRLLAERHAAHARAQPLLGHPAADPCAVQEHVRALWTSSGADGVVAVDDGDGSTGDLAGYLVGTAKPGPAWVAHDVLGATTCCRLEESAMRCPRARVRAGVRRDVPPPAPVGGVPTGGATGRDDPGLS